MTDTDPRFSPALAPVRTGLAEDFASAEGRAEVSAEDERLAMVAIDNIIGALDHDQQVAIVQAWGWMPYEADDDQPTPLWGRP